MDLVTLLTNRAAIPVLMVNTQDQYRLMLYPNKQSFFPVGITHRRYP
ncbi:MAG: hypothetical protein BWY82_00210 [Verrucomicrobia bacterium ADurb.Bin474]|nr:MAG: hypothetical protein BWY82_00210 [Verrucomicrobia bacterium ADurb.Bin474]